MNNDIFNEKFSVLKSKTRSYDFISCMRKLKFSRSTVRNGVQEGSRYAAGL